MAELRFEWDERKRRANLKKHGLDFEDAWRLFDDASMQTYADVRSDYGEERWVGLGSMLSTVVVAVFVNPLPGVIRIVSLRKADRDEEADYWENAFSD